jgi:hypothetical protein
MADRARVVTRAVMGRLIDTMHKELSPTEFCQWLEETLRDEFADAAAQAIVDRELPDA